MIRTYRFAPAYTQHRWEPPIPEEVLQEALWIDLEDPSPEEVAQIESYFQVRFPSSQEEARNRSQLPLPGRRRLCADLAAPAGTMCR